MNSYPQQQDGGNKFVEGLATGGLLAGLGYFSLNPKRRAEARQKISELISPDAKSATAGVRQVDLQAKRAASPEVRAAAAPLAPAERPTGVVLGDLPQPKTATDPWTGRETITDPFGVPTVPPGPGIKERRFVFGDKVVRGQPETLIPEPTAEEMAQVFGRGQDTSLLDAVYPPTPLTKEEIYQRTTQREAAGLLPRVFKPQGYFDVDLITDPNTGEVFKRGKSPASFAETYISLRPELTGQRTDLPQGRTPGTFAEFSQKASALQAESNTAQSAAQSDFGPQQYLKAKQYIEADTMVDQQDARLGLQVDQSVAAVNSAEDQATGRVMHRIQSDHDTDLGAVNAAKEQVEAALQETISRNPELATSTSLDAAANTVADSLPGGVPIDQAEGTVSAKRFFQSERDEIASQLGEQGLPVSPSRVEAELGRRLGSEAYQYGPKYTQRKQALQLGATYSPKFFENIKTPSVKIAGETVPTSSLREPVVMEETAQRLQERVAQKKDWLGNVRLQEQQKQIRLGNEVERLAQEDIALGKEIDSLLNVPKTFSSPEAARQASSQRALADVALDRQDVIDSRISQLQKELLSSASRVSGAEKSTQEQIQGLVLPQKLKSGIEEGQRIFFEADEITGKPIPGTQELRSERRMVDMTPKGGGGRNVAEFTAGTRDEGVEIDLENILQQARTPQDQSGREYQKDQFGYRPGTGLTGKPLEGQPFTDDRTQTGRVITRTGIQKTGPQPGSMEAAVNPYTQLDDETLGMISLQGSGADAINAARVLARRRREGFDPSTITGPGQSQRVVSSVDLTPEQKQAKIRSMDVSQQIAALQRSGRPDAQQLVQKYLEQLR